MSLSSGFTLEQERRQEELQSMFQNARRGMNFGMGGGFESSGEYQAIQKIRGELLKKYCEPYILFDVGANEGEYTRFLSNIFAGEAVIHAFEPSLGTFEVLRQRLGEAAELHRLAFGEQSGFALLYSNSNSGLSSFYNRNLKHFGIVLDKTESIYVLTLDEFCQTMGIQHIHFLKMDVEGHELQVLKGAKKILEQRGVDFIQFEFGGCNIDSRTFFQDFFYLLSPQYRLFRVLADGLWPVESYRESEEFFDGPTNYMCELI
jgi:FkbM family methyltransferase